MKVERALRLRGRAVILAALLGGGGSPLSGCYGKSNEAGPAVAVDVEGLYAQMCARCHGPDGRGDAEMKKTIPGIRDFGDPQFRARGMEDVEAVIMTGRNQMPGFGGALTRPKIQHLGGYVRRLGDIAAGGGKAGGTVPVGGVPAPGAPAPAPVAPGMPAPGTGAPK
jgi:mono/diheme cytochrome c family protein